MRGISFPLRRLRDFVAMLAALGVATSVPAAAQARAATGYVVEIRGPWYVAGSAPRRLALGAPVSAGDTIRAARERDRGQRLTIAMRANRPISIACADSYAERATVTCPQLVVPALVGADGSRLARVLHEVMARIANHEPERYTPLMSRGATGPADAVALLRAGGLDVGAALAELDGGRYDLCLARFRVPDSAGSLASAHQACDQRVRYDWSPRHSAPATVGALPPGLYSLRVSSPDVNGDAWLLVEDSSRYAAESDEFATLRSAMRHWGPELATAARRIERAWLVSAAGAKRR